MAFDIEPKNIQVSTETNVAQANALIENKPHMSVFELKLFSTLVASIDYNDTELRDVRVPIRDVIKLLEANPKNAYGQIKRALVGLSKKQFQVETLNHDGTRTVVGSSYIAGYRFTEGSSIAYISISPVFAPYLISLKKNYTTYMLQNVIHLANPNAIRTYELLAQYRKLGKRYFTVKEYKKKIGIEGKYKGNNSNLRNKVLIPVCEEISEQTDIITRAVITGRGEDAKIEFMIIQKEHVAGPKGKVKRRIDNGDLDMLVDLATTAIDMRAHFSDAQIRAMAEHLLQILPNKASVSDAFILCSNAYHTYAINELKGEIEKPVAYFIALLEDEVSRFDAQS